MLQWKVRTHDQPGATRLTLNVQQQLILETTKSTCFSVVVVPDSSSPKTGAKWRNRNIEGAVHRSKCNTPRQQSGKLDIELHCPQTVWCTYLLSSYTLSVLWVYTSRRAAWKPPMKTSCATLYLAWASPVLSFTGGLCRLGTQHSSPATTGFYVGI
jgi:hypothetical protein